MLFLKSLLALVALSLLSAEETLSLAYETDNSLSNNPVRDMFKGVDFFNRLKQRKPAYFKPPYLPKRPATYQLYVPDDELCLSGKSLAYDVISSSIGALSSPKNKYAIREITGVMGGNTCISACEVNPDCSFAVVEKINRKCVLYYSKASYFLTPSDNACLYSKDSNQPLYNFNHKSLASSLVHYWPIVNFKIDDLINQADMFNCVNASIGEDRFQNPDSALDLRMGYCQLPIGAYLNYPKGFSLSHSILLRATPNSLDSFFEFTKNTKDDDSEDFWIISSPNLNNVFVNQKEKQTINATEVIVPLYKWVHIGYVSDGYSGNLYYNGKLVGSTKGKMWKPVVFIENYVGKDPWYTNTSLDALFDEFRIYGTPLTPAQIYEDSQIGSYLQRIY